MIHIYMIHMMDVYARKHNTVNMQSITQVLHPYFLTNPSTQYPFTAPCFSTCSISYGSLHTSKELPCSVLVMYSCIVFHVSFSQSSPPVPYCWTQYSRPSEITIMPEATVSSMRCFILVWTQRQKWACTCMSGGQCKVEIL